MARQVSGPTTPSASSPCARWNERTRLTVVLSIVSQVLSGSPSRRWTSLTLMPFIPAVRTTQPRAAGIDVTGWR